MVFETQELNERKSLDYCNSKKLINSAKRLKAPTPQIKFENIEHDDDDKFFLNKSVEIKQRSRNKATKLNGPPKMQTYKSQNALKKSKPTAQNRLFFKPYNTMNGAGQGGNKRYSTSTREMQ